MILHSVCAVRHSRREGCAHLVQILLSLGDPDGKRLAHVPVARLKDELPERFGGLTA